MGKGITRLTGVGCIVEMGREKRSSFLGLLLVDLWVWGQNGELFWILLQE